MGGWAEGTIEGTTRGACWGIGRGRGKGRDARDAIRGTQCNIHQRSTVSRGAWFGHSCMRFLQVTRSNPANQCAYVCNGGLFCTPCAANACADDDTGKILLVARCSTAGFCTACRTPKSYKTATGGRKPAEHRTKSCSCRSASTRSCAPCRFQLGAYTPVSAHHQRRTPLRLPGLSMRRLLAARGRRVFSGALLELANGLCATLPAL